MDAEWNELEATRLEYIGLEAIRLEWVGLSQTDWIRLDWVGLVRLEWSADGAVPECFLDRAALISVQSQYGSRPKPNGDDYDTQRMARSPYGLDQAI